MHVLLFDRSVTGWEYGMLRCLEDEIVRQTGANRIDVTPSGLGRWLNRRISLGTRHAHFRRFVPKKRIALPEGAQVVWHVLMGPENYRLDRHFGLDGQATHRIVYLFDTLPSQMPVLRPLFSGPQWNVRVTSFDDAIPMLEAQTGGRWHHADQAVSLKYFEPVPFEQKIIHFSSYGRRHPVVHEALVRFCAARGLYYDYTTHGRGHPTAEPLELLKQFAWHMGHSLFTVCWPVELTHPQRAGALSPITCRWFEAAAAGAVVIGQPPANPRFKALFGDDFVAPLDPARGIDQIILRLEQIWENRAELSAKALARRERMGVQLDWSERVKTMLELTA